MDSWWQLGEGSGYGGVDLDTHRISCPFCLEKGNFETVFHVEKKKPNGKKKLNFDTLECGSCKGYVLVMWSTSETSWSREGLHDFRVVPWTLKIDKYPEHWPDTVGRYWLQAKRNVQTENWDAATVMARSALQYALRDQKAEGKNLKQEIDDLATKGVLPPTMKDWSDQVRELGNESAHPSLDGAPTDAQDAKDIVRFLDFLLEYLYTLPHQINNYRERAKKA